MDDLSIALAGYVAAIKADLARGGVVEAGTCAGLRALIVECFDEGPASVAQVSDFVRELSTLAPSASKPFVELAQRLTTERNRNADAAEFMDALGVPAVIGGQVINLPVKPRPPNPVVSWPTVSASELAGEPHAPRFIIGDWLPAGYATLFAGHGGLGKSAIALQIAASIAGGVPFHGLACEPRPVLYVSAEDRLDVMHWRLKHFCARGGLLLQHFGALHLAELVGKEAVLVGRGAYGEIVRTRAYETLAETMRETGAKVLVVDGASDTFGGNENDRTQVKQYVNALVGLIDPDDGAVLIVGHVAKPTAQALRGNGTATEGYSGSTAWHNACRARWYLYPVSKEEDDSGDLILELQKSNHGRADQQLRFGWEKGAFVSRGEQSAPRASSPSDQDAILAVMFAAYGSGQWIPAAGSGRRTTWAVLRARSDFPAELGRERNAKRFWDALEALRAAGKVEEFSAKQPGQTRSHAYLRPAFRH